MNAICYELVCYERGLFPMVCYEQLCFETEPFLGGYRRLLG